MDVDADLPGLEVMPPEDQMAIGETLGALLGGFGRRNAAMMDAAYSEDADWVNAFGTVKTGRAAIIDYLRGLFADEAFNAGKMAAPPVSRLRRLAATAVAVSTHLQILDQGLVGGGTISRRDNHSLRILEKQADGRWLIVSEIYMDARQDQTYAAQG